MANVVACSIVCNRLNYCNSVLYGITAHNIDRLQRVQNSFARVVCRAPYRSSATHCTGCRLRSGFTFKIAVLTYKVRNHRQPTYLSSMITDYKPARCLRSAVSDLLVIYLFIIYFVLSTSKEQIKRENRPQLNKTSD